MRSSPAAIVTALLFAASATGRTQDIAPAATAEVVRLDVVVTDERGNSVGGLAREDFAVLEDGRPQRITDFVYLTRPAAASAVGAAAAAAAAPAPAPAKGAVSGPRAETADRPGRRIAIIVDEPHLAPRSLETAKDVLRRFLSDDTAPEDEVAFVVVGTPSATIQPTRERVALRQALERIHARADSIVTGQGAQLTPDQAEQILSGDPSALELGTRLLTEDPGQLTVTSNSGTAVFRGRNSSTDPTPAGVENDVRGLALDVERQARTVLAEALALSETSLNTVEQVLRGMAPLPGRKLCLLVSDGFLVGRGTNQERTRGLEQVVDAATRSGTAVYSLVGSGLVSIIGDAATVASNVGPAGLRDRVARAGERLTIQTLQGLADDTGGLVMRGSEGIATGVTRMLHDSDALYLLAYEPANKKRDGRFRRIDVRLPGHRDYVLRTRRGYFAADDSKRRPAERSATLEARLTPEAHVTPGMPAAGPQRPLALSIAAARKALALPPPQAGVALRMAADFVELTPGQPEALVKARLDPEGLPWTKGEGRQRTEFDLIGGVFGASGQPGPLFAGRHYVLDVTPAELERLKETGVRFEANFPLKPGRYEIRMLALDTAHTPLGGGTSPIQIPDLAQQKLALSSVFLSSSAASRGEGEGPGVEVGEALRDAQVLRRFKASDSLYYKVYVYNAARDATGASDVVLQSQILSARRPPFASKPQQALLREKDGTPLPEGDGIPLLGLVPGRYELRIVAADRKTNAVVSRSVDFTVVE
jgi:VWFA-related protein